MYIFILYILYIFYIIIYITTHIKSTDRSIILGSPRSFGSRWTHATSRNNLTKVATRRREKEKRKGKGGKRPRERLRMQSTPITVWPCHARTIGNLARLDFHLDPSRGSTCDPTNPLTRRIVRLNFYEPERREKSQSNLRLLTREKSSTR